MNSNQSSSSEIAELYDRLLEGLHTRPKSADQPINRLTKLDFFAALAPKQIPDWFNFFVSQPPMPKVPADETSLSENIRSAAREWLRDSDSWDIEDYPYLTEGDRKSLEVFQQKWVKYMRDTQEAQIHFQMLKELQWPWFWARQMVHHGENA
jgi:hypothetical protein